MPDTKTKQDKATQEISGKDAPVISVLNRVLAPLARLCLANGISYATINEVVKRVLVEQASALQPGLPEHGKVSRISTATGINRYEVTRLTRLEPAELVAKKQPQAFEIIDRWTTEQTYRDPNGDILGEIQRLGAAPSFEALAREVTRNVHHRSLMDELIRLEIISYDEERDLVSLIRRNFVPSNDSSQMLGLLGDNVGDHLHAAVTNVMNNGTSHLEQAIFADELSTESMNVLKPLIMAHWKTLHDEMIPAINALIDADAHAGRPQDQRVRIGLYSYNEPTIDQESSPSPAITRRFRKSAAKDMKK